MNEKVKVIKVELKQEYGEEKLKTYYPEDVELDDIIMSVYSLLNFTSIMFEYSSYQFALRRGRGTAFFRQCDPALCRPFPHRSGTLPHYDHQVG